MLFFKQKYLHSKKVRLNSQAIFTMRKCKKKQIIEKSFKQILFTFNVIYHESNENIFLLFPELCPSSITSQYSSNRFCFRPSTFKRVI